MMNRIDQIAISACRILDKILPPFVGALHGVWLSDLPDPHPEAFLLVVL